MNLYRPAFVVGLAACTALTLPALAEKPGDNDTTTSSDGTTTYTCEQGTVSLAGPQVLWPPNHKMVTQVGTATNSDNTEATTLTLNVDQLADIADSSGGDGGDNGADSSGAATGAGTGSATTDFDVRAERSGKGDGRVYTIHWTATFGTDSCSSDSSSTDELKPFEIFVPHDQGQGKAKGRS